MNRAERGFTLFEVLVALAIAAVVLSAAVKLVGLYVGNSARIQERLYGHWAASNLLELIPSAGGERSTPRAGRSASPRSWSRG